MIRTTFALACFFLFPLQLLAQSGVTAVLAPSDTPLRPGATGSVGIIVLNAGTDPATVELPANLPATLTRESMREEVTLVRRDRMATTLPVAPSAFVRAEYSITVPAGMAGNVMIEVSGSPPIRGVLLVQAGAPSIPDPLATKLESSKTPSTAPLVDTSDQNARSGFVEYFASHFSGHEPVYFLFGTERPNAKFQFSFKYRVLNPEGSWSKAIPALGGFHLAYSQTSFWDLEGESKPFYDNSYRPELLFAYDSILPKDWNIPGVSRVGLQLGLQHESNGRAGADSRSMNIAYVRPIFVFGEEKGLFLTLAPRVFTYVQDVDDNPDIADYRGHADLRATVGWDGGLQLAAVARLGDDADKGSLQLDLTYPLRQRLGGNMDVYLHAQFFTGYGESLLDYNRSDNTFRLGISMVR